jgi:hypothetical protein
MTDDTRGTSHKLLHMRLPKNIRIPNFEPELFPRLTNLGSTLPVQTFDSQLPALLRTIGMVDPHGLITNPGPMRFG